MDKATVPVLVVNPHGIDSNRKRKRNPVRPAFLPPITQHLTPTIFYGWNRSRAVFFYSTGIAWFRLFFLSFIQFGYLFPACFRLQSFTITFFPRPPVIPAPFLRGFYPVNFQLHFLSFFISIFNFNLAFNRFFTLHVPR
ncbi:MAG: hypothetical protein ACFFD4_21605 [Candidatus Odinarchaeota archaeon]